MHKNLYSLKSYLTKPLVLLILICSVIITFTYFVKFYFVNVIETNWEKISREKLEETGNECAELFYSYQNQTKEFSDKLISNRRFINSFLNQNMRRTYESFFDIPESDQYNTELYNSRLELFMFSGRQILPGIVELRRALGGERFSQIKEIGLYSYINIFTPVVSESGQTEGVLVVSRLLDVDAYLRNRLFENSGISSEIYNKYNIDAEFRFKDTQTYNQPEPEYTALNLKSINGEPIGKLFIPKLDKSSYILSIEKKFDNYIVFIIFTLNIIFLYFIFIKLKNKSPSWFNLTIPVIFLILSRYLWLITEFPSRYFREFDFDLFSPSHYASAFGFGIAKSLGELLISSIILALIFFYILSFTIKFHNEQKRSFNLAVSLSISVLLSLIGVIFIHTYGVIVQSLIYESTIRFIDKSEIFSFNQPEHLIMRINILLISLSLLSALVSILLIADKFLKPFYAKFRVFRRNPVVIATLIFISITTLTYILPVRIINLSLNFWLGITIAILISVLAIYIANRKLHERTYHLLNIRSISLFMLTCILFIPAVMLNKIISQENHYLERAAKEIAFQPSDKIIFLVSAAMEEARDYPELSKDIHDPNKVSKLAFNVWARSRFYDEDINSAVLILDTNKKVISDFNINPNELNSDSVINFSLRNLHSFSSPADNEIYEGEPDSLDTDPMTLMQFDEGKVLQNSDMKFYTSVLPIENPNLRKSGFKNILGYIIIAAGYEAKNYLTQSNSGIFRNFTKSRILNKLTSPPIITEFSNGEIAGSSNREISRSFTKSLDAFRESVKDKVDKSALRYDEFENQIYKSYYVLTERRISKDLPVEKIYILSVKINDFSLISFFFFRYLLFIVTVFLVIFAIYVLYKLVVSLALRPKIKFIKFGFREKVFVSFLLASLIPILVLAVYTREFVKNKNEEFYNNSILSDLKLVENYVKKRKDELSSGSLKGDTGHREIFSKGFNQSEKNFNYYLKNKLVSTTSEQLYKSDLLDSRISGKAYYNISLLKRDFFSESQQLGNFTFIVGYKPVYDKLNNLDGIISTQTVFRQYEINSELTESLVYILGPYFSAVIILIFIVNFLSYRISNPILKLQKATEQLSKGNIDIKVKTTAKDEIGELVRSFNKMVKELKRSREVLKKAEREGAWRDIARQVAHEIKNPLTPMKLAMQYLYSSYKNNRKNFNEVLDRTNKLIIDQIESLNRIATEFSDFAKLPSRNYEALNINEILSDVVNLLNSNNLIKLNTSSEISDVKIMGDKDGVKRAFFNILKNSLQAIEAKEKDNGNIQITAEKINGYLNIKISDNGVGMSKEVREKLFEPYFSTKSSGMGLGLVITKKILDDMQADIYVNSTPDVGTEVNIRFPVK